MLEQAIADRGGTDITLTQHSIGLALSFKKDGKTYRHAVLTGVPDRERVLLEWVKQVAD